MEPTSHDPLSPIPPAYKKTNFLPSVGVQIFIVIICFGFVSFWGIPKLYKTIKSWGNVPTTKFSLSATVLPDGDPTTRNILGDGIPDWQKILVGIDPKDPDGAAKFKKIKDAVGASTFDFSASQVTDTDKVSLALYDGIGRDSINQGSVTPESITNFTQAEIKNYIEAKQKTLKIYTSKDFVASEGNDIDIITAYYKDMQGTNGNIIDKDFATHLQAYILGKESKDVYISGKINEMQNLLQKLLSISVPTTALAMHTAGTNAISQMIQILDSYIPSSEDTISQFATTTLIQGFISGIQDINNQLAGYFWITLEKK